MVNTYCFSGVRSKNTFSVLEEVVQPENWMFRFVQLVKPGKQLRVVVGCIVWVGDHLLDYDFVNLSTKDFWTFVLDVQY
jgi:hypothetical protein